MAKEHTHSIEGHSLDDDKAITQKINQCLDSIDLVRLFRTGVLDVDGVLKKIAEAGDEIIQMKAGWSLLHPFSVLGCYEIVEKLWERGLRPSIAKCAGSTVLHCAVRTYPPHGAATHDLERAKILTLYLSSGEDFGNNLPMNALCNHGWTALKLAVRLNLVRCVEVLLKYGADTQITDPEGYSPLHNAVGNHDIVKMLLNADSANIDAPDSEGNTALLLSLKTGTTGGMDSAMVLLERNANPNVPNKEGEWYVITK